MPVDHFLARPKKRLPSSAPGNADGSWLHLKLEMVWKIAVIIR